MPTLARCIPRSVRPAGGVVFALLLSGGCNGVLPLPPGTTAWTRHTIDDSYRGADGVKLGDINGDGLTDLVVGWEESGVVTLHLNPGPARARLPWPTVGVGRVQNVEDAVFADVDNDGRLDVVSSCPGRTRRMYVHWAPADNADLLDTAAWVTEVIPASVGVQQWMFCMPAQLDGQGGFELIAGGQGNGASIGYLAARGDARNLANWTWTPLASASWIMSIIPADVDSDGDVDIAYTDRQGGGRGAYWLENPTVGGLLLWLNHRIGTTDDEAMFMDLGDFDGDGRFDAFVATSGRRAVHYRPIGDPRLAWSAVPITWSDTFGTGKAIRIADLDRDGSRELVFSCENAGDGRVGLGRLTALAVGGANVWTATALTDTAGRKFDVLQLLDVDGDGDTDIITTEESAGLGVVWYENPR